MFISTAFAQELLDEASDMPVEEPSFWVSMLPLVVILIIFYFMIIRPQNKRIREHHNMVDSLRRGDRVVTQGGLIATVKKLSGDDEVVLELNKGVEVKAVRSTIMHIRSASAPAANANAQTKDKKAEDK